MSFCGKKNDLSEVFMDYLKHFWNFITDAEPVDLVILAVVILIPVVALIALISSAVNGAKRKKAEKESAAEEPVAKVEKKIPAPAAAPAPAPAHTDSTPATPAAATAPVAAPAPAPVARAVAPAPTQEAHRVTVYVPEVQPKEQKRVKVCVKNLKKADKTLLAATAIFCVGLGAMIQRALTGDK